MKNLLALLVLLALFGFNLNAQNVKVDSLNKLIAKKQLEIESLKNQMISEMTINGYGLKVKPRFTHIKIIKLKSSPLYGAATIDTIPIGSTVLVLENLISYYKVKYESRIGYLSSTDIEIGESPIKIMPFKNNYTSTSSINSTSSYKASSSYKSSSGKSSGCSTVRCSGRTQKGARCKRKTKSCSGRCHSH